MSAIVLDASKVNSYVLPSLNKSENLMQTSYSTSVSLKNSLPSSFSQRSAVNQIVNQIYNIKKEINDIEGIIDSKLASAKRIESKSESRVSSIASAASKIGSVVGAIGGAALGATTGSIVGTAAGAAVGSSVGSTVGKALVNTGAKIVDGAVKVGNTIWNGIKSIGSWIWDGCKKVANAVTSFVKQAVSGLVKAAKAIWEGLKWVGKQILRVGATIVNVVVSLVEGLVSFVEAIGDFVLLVIGGVCSIFTAISDIITGCITGEWNWTATSAVWKKWIMPWVGYDWTSKAFEWQGKWVINDWTYKPFKRGETGAKITKGVGYVAGVVILTIVTFGAGGAAAGAASAAGTGASAAGATGATALTTSIASATSLSTTAVIQIGSGVVAGSASMAKNVQSGYNELSEEEKQSGAAIAKTLGNSVVQGTIEGTTFALTYGGGLKGDMLGKTVSSYFKSHKGIEIATKAGIQATKAYVSDGAESLITGKEFNFAETTQDAFVNAAVSVVYDTTISKPLKNVMSNIGKTNNSMGIEVTEASSIKGAFVSSVNQSVIKESKLAAGMAAQTISNGKVYGKIVKDVMKLPLNEVIDAIQEKAS